MNGVNSTVFGVNHTGGIDFGGGLCQNDTAGGTAEARNGEGMEEWNNCRFREFFVF